MAHLSNVELVDAMELGAAPDVVAHLAACDRCRRYAEQLRATVGLARSVDQPEPSPFFWTSFAARVSAAIKDGTAARDHRWWAVRHPRWGWSSVGALAVLLGVAGGLVLQPASSPPAGSLQVAAEHPLAPGVDAELVDLETEVRDQDGTWLLVADAGADVDWDVASAAGLGPAPGSAESAVAGLTEVERSELARLLELALAGDPL